MTAADGAILDLTWYHPSGSDGPGSAALYLHGGGMIFGLEHVGTLYDLAVREYVAASGVPMLMVDYRVAPEHPDPSLSRTATARWCGWPSTPKTSVSTPPAWQ